MAFWRYTEAAPDLSGLVSTGDLNTAIGGVQLDLSQTNAQLAAYIASQNAQQSGGMAISVPMTGTGMAPLPSSLVQDAKNGMALNNDTCVVNYPFAANQTYSFKARTNVPLATNDMSSVVTWKGLVPGNAGVVAAVRVNSAMTDYVFAKATQGKIELFYVIAGVVGQFATANISTPSNGTLECRCSDKNYSVFYNGVQVLNFTDSLNYYPIDVSHQFAGYGMYTYNGLSFGTSSPPITSFNASDIAVPPTLGTGWELYRANTSGQPQSAGGVQLSAVWDSIHNQANVTIPSLSSGVVTIIKAGWYAINLRVFTSGANAGTGIYSTRLYGNLTGGTLAEIRSGGDTTGSQIQNTVGSWIIYLPAGAKVAPGFFSTAARSINGEATGTRTYWSGALVSIGG